jgi:tetratricopeptide (TPR) repeat protein
MDALRAFLEGERHFQRLDTKKAKAEYRRAFELDSNFAQAYLRYDYAVSWDVTPADTAVRRRLIALKDRLPERERLWVEANEATSPLPQRVAQWKALAERYPDYPPFLMAAADPIVHFGPVYGIPLEDARPFLERLDMLVPDHADTRLHMAIVEGKNDNPDVAATAFRNAGAESPVAFGKLLTNTGDLLHAAASKGPMPSEEQWLDIARTFMKEDVRGVQLQLTGFGALGRVNAVEQLKMVRRVRDAGIYSGDLAQSLAFGESSMLAERGDFVGAIAAARAMTQSTLSLSMRLTAARLAVLAAWLEAVHPSVADTLVTAARSWDLARATSTERSELAWLDGMVGVMTGNESRFRNAMLALNDTTPTSRHTAGTLSAMWINRADPGKAADSLRGVSDDVMRNGGYVMSAEAIGRLLIARRLRQKNEPANVERYLMWTDGGMNNPIAVTPQYAVGPVTSFERASALDAAGQRDGAIRHYRRFLDAYDMAPPAHREMVAEAKSRLAALEALDSRQSKSVTPVRK